MASCPGYKLEDYVRYLWSLSVSNEHADVFQNACYANLRILTDAQFAHMVAIYEMWREHVEEKLADYDEDRHGSFRSYWAAFYVPDEFDKRAEGYLKSIRPPLTKGLF
jgi:hypothetical protein